MFKCSPKILCYTIASLLRVPKVRRIITDLVSKKMTLQHWVAAMRAKVQLFERSEAIFLKKSAMHELGKQNETVNTASSWYAYEGTNLHFC